MPLFPAAVDYSWSRPSPSSIAAAGYMGALRYLGASGDGRAVTANEIAALHAAGLGVGFVYESTSDRTLSGAAGGSADAARANAIADAIGVPDSLPLVLVTIDFGATAAQLRGPIAEYARAAIASSKRPVRAYGHNLAVEILCGELGLFPCAWQCAAWSGTGSGSAGTIQCGDGSNRPLSRFACFFQDVGYVLGNSSDHNSLHMDRTELLWHPDWMPGTTSPTPQPPKDEDTMDAAIAEDGTAYWLVWFSGGRNYQKKWIQTPEEVGFWTGTQQCHDIGRQDALLGWTPTIGPSPDGTPDAGTLAAIAAAVANVPKATVDELAHRVSGS